VANGREPYDDPRFDEPMFMTSNGLAPIILDPSAQGQPKLGSDGKPLPALTAPDQESDVEKTLADFIANEDQEDLHFTCRSLKRSKAHE
jgi:hypothetical protein